MSPAAPFPQNEQERIVALHALSILDTPEEERFNRIIRIVRHVFQVPIAMISLVDSDRQWFKACYGLTDKETSREESFCAYTLLDQAPLIVPNALKDLRFANNANVRYEPFIRFYAGYPLKNSQGYVLGTLCIIDHVPRQFQAQELEMLHDLAQTVEREINLSSTQTIILPQWKQGHRFQAIRIG